MRALIIVGALALVLGGCLQQTGERAAETSCAAAASQPWHPLSGAEFTIEASSAGPDCEHAVATLVIRDAQNDVLWADAAASARIMTLLPARDVAAMEAALGEWINSSNHTMVTTSALPDWPAEATSPVSGEFPFYPEQHWDRVAYMELRAQNAPMFCYVQGMESQACLALRGGNLEKVGVQTFPG